MYVDTLLESLEIHFGVLKESIYLRLYFSLTLKYGFDSTLPNSAS